MGERASRLEMANADDAAQMRALTSEAMRAGAMGFSTSRSINHKSVSGTPTPTLRASELELTAIAMGVKDAGRGILQMITDFDAEDVDGEFALMRRLMEASGRPLTFSLVQKHKNRNGWKRVLELTKQAVDDGLKINAQIAPRGVGILLGLQGSRNVFSECPSYQAIAHLPFEERVRLLRDPQVRQTLVRELREHSKTPLGQRLVEFTNIFPFGDPPNYDPGPEQSLAAIGEREGRDPAEVAYDQLLADDGHGMLYSPFANYPARSLDVRVEVIADPNTVIGLGDGGARVGLVSDSSFQTFVLSHWQHKFDLTWLVKRQTSDTARTVGLYDRGVIAPGMKADINVIDPAELGMAAPHMQFDLPAGGRRLLQRSRGYDATIVSGVVVYRNGEATGALPGRLVRGPQAVPPDTPIFSTSTRRHYEPPRYAVP